MDRRKFLKGGGLFGALLGAAALPTAIEKIAVASSSKQSVTEETAVALESNPMTLQLQAGYDEKITEQPVAGGFYFNPQPKYNKQVNVAMKPGPDGHLYIKINDQWKRILTT